jgi:formamidopyrimidine-DNA glycosylase
MPELPEVETARRRLELHLAGKTLATVTSAADRIVYEGIAPRRFAAALKGRTVEAVRRKGKHLWLELDRRPWPSFHFGMGGDFHVYRDRAERPRYWKVELATAGGTRLAMTNARRLGRIRLFDDPASEPPISRLGPDPYLELPSPAAFARLFAGRKAPVKALLLDQTVLAGIGNWIADEVLYQAGLDPRRPAASLDPAELRRLRSRLKAVLDRAVRVGSDDGRFPRTWLFHYRWGRTAGARTGRGEEIVFLTVGGRTTAFVPAAQR